jgi:hypothetical protein
MSGDDQKWRESLKNESYQIQTAATVWGDTHRRRASFLHSVSMSLALLSAPVATLAGATTLTAGGATGGNHCAGGSGFGCHQHCGWPDFPHGGGAGRRAIANTILADGARVFAETVAPYTSQEEALRGFKTLLDQRDDVVRNAPIEAPGTLKKVEKELRDLEKKQEPPPTSHAPGRARDQSG